MISPNIHLKYPTEMIHPPHDRIRRNVSHDLFGENESTLIKSPQIYKETRTYHTTGVTPAHTEDQTRQLQCQSHIKSAGCFHILERTI